MVVFEITKPLNAPIISPISIPIIIARCILIPYLDTQPAASTPESAITEPTDRSIPPSIITIVIPQARSIFVDICLNTLKTFFVVGNELLVAGNTVRNTASTSNAIIIPIFSLKKFNAFFIQPPI